VRFPVEGWLDDTIGIADTAKSEDGHPELVTECPHCGRTRKLWVNKRTGKWICYSCREGGALPSLIAVVEGMSHRDAIRFVAAAVKKSLRRSVKQSAEAVTRWKPEPDQEGLGFCTAGRYGGRLILPAHQFGDLVFYQGRAMAAPIKPKYLSPPVAGASGTLYGLDEAVGVSEVLVVEGPLDVVSMAQRGFHAVSLLGKELTGRQAVKLKRAGFVRAIVMLDGDAITWGARAAATLRMIGIEALLAKLPREHDPDSAPADVVRDAVRRAAPPTLRDRLLGSH